MWLLTLCVAVGAGCGGGGGSGGDDVIDFDIGSVGSVSDAEVVELTRDKLTSVVFLADWLTLVQAFQSHGAVMSSLGDASPETVNLGWVRRVHDSSERAQVYHGEGLRLQIPAEAPANYESIYGVYIAGVEAFGFASARLLGGGADPGPVGKGVRRHGARWTSCRSGRA